MNDYKRISGIIKTIATRGASLDKLIQTTGLDILKHIEQHGDVSLACKLYKAMPKGSRRNALAGWFIAFGKLKAQDDKSKSQEFPLVFDRSKVTNIEGATDKPWFEFKKEKDIADEFSLDHAIAVFRAKVQRAIDKGQLEENDERVAQIKAIKFDEETKAA